MTALNKPSSPHLLLLPLEESTSISSSTLAFMPSTILPTKLRGKLFSYFRGQTYIACPVLIH